MVISEVVAQQSGLDVAEMPRHELTVRNRHEALAIYVVDDVSKIADRLRSTASERL